jgi:hypothetical protein
MLCNFRDSSCAFCGDDDDGDGEKVRKMNNLLEFFTESISLFYREQRKIEY